MRSKSKVFLALALVFILVASVPMSAMVSDADSTSSNDTYSSDIGYKSLDEHDQDAYKSFEKGIEVVEKTGELLPIPMYKTNTHEDKLMSVQYAYMSDHPDKFWASYYDTYYKDSSGRVIGFEVKDETKKTLSMTLTKLNSMKAELQNKIDGIAPSDANASIGDRIKYLHDTINNRTEYQSDTKKYPNCGNVYGLLCEGKSKCDSYSLTFALLCHRESIPCVVEIGYITKDGPENGGHAWNIVKTDKNLDENKNWYYMDLTWDDTIGYDYRYEYFMIGSQTNVQGGSFQSSRTIYFDYYIDVSKDRYNYEPYSFLEKNKAVIAVIVVIVIIVIAFLIWRYTKKKKEQRLQAEMANAINSGECCPACGTPIPPGQDFCPACGKKAKIIEDEKEPPQQ